MAPCLRASAEIGEPAVDSSWVGFPCAKADLMQGVLASRTSCHSCFTSRKGSGLIDLDLVWEHKIELGPRSVAGIIVAGIEPSIRSPQEFRAVCCQLQ